MTAAQTAFPADMPRQWYIRRAMSEYGRVRRDSGYWLIDCMAGGQRYKLRGWRTTRGKLLRFRTKKEATDALDQVRVDLRGGSEPIRAIAEFLPLGAPRTLFEHHYEKFCRARAKDKANPISGSRAAALIGHLERGYLDELKKIPVAALSYRDLEDWVAALFARTELGANSVRHVATDVRTFLRWLARREEIRAAPEVPLVSYDEYVPNVPTAAVQERVISAIPERKRGLFLARGFMGLRPSEARRANLSDYRFNPDSADELMIPKSKSKRYRLLPVPAPVSAWVRGRHPAANLRDANAPEVPLFPNPDAPGDGRWQPTAEYRTVRRAMKICGVKYRPNELMRHAFGTDVANRMLGEGGAEGDVSRLIMAFMGHTQVGTSAKYVRLGTERLKRIVRNVSAGENDPSNTP